MTEYQDMEQAILDRLTPTMTDLGARTVEVYSGQLTGDMRDAVKAFPAVFVSLLGMEFKSVNRTDRATLRVAVFVCARSLRGTEGRLGAQGLMEAVRSRLHRHAVLPGRWEPLRVERERVMYVDSGTGMAVCEARYMSETIL